ncbi:DUF58 domain-containing protein [Gillisia sp. M10.2A]|uniref:DUF58 domain-containing protein n=1 Tax=Gillisia lutea TaxID=2909668 RepID=A0ABS9EHP2_9FLAO|nr:DUF58 domain-containing protein [Gillisia lutea]MCF4101842.1 DUF58 domain-containing protein [Gillisia lutea]
MLKFVKAIYFHQRFFVGIFAIATIFLFSYWIAFLYPIAWILAVLLSVFSLLDITVLFSRNAINANRQLPEKLSNSDLNTIYITLENKHAFKVSIEIIDELPIQFQKRDFLQKLQLSARQKDTVTYGVRPVERGEYIFGKLNIYVSTPLKLIKKRLIFNEDQEVKVYPSFIQMKQYDFLAIDNRLNHVGLKKIRRIGHTQEFEQIKEYVSGDDIRSINWKATAKHGDLMVNQYQDEKAQPVYSIIDIGRVMKMPFNGLSLLDYAVNSSLAFSNIALKKKDKVGMLTFSNEPGNLVAASSKKTHLNQLLESLYNIKTAFLDSDFGLLYAWVKRSIKHRSLLLIYTNFEHMNGLERQLPYLKALSQKHVVVVIFFENTEVEALINKNVEGLPKIAHQTIAEDFSFEKRLMVKKLQQNGIQSVLTRPEDLSVNTINKYLEIKARGLL